MSTPRTSFQKTPPTGPRRRWPQVIAAAIAVTAAVVSLLSPAPARATIPANGSDLEREGVLTSIAVNPTGLGHWVHRDQTERGPSSSDLEVSTPLNRKGSTVAHDGAPQFKQMDWAGLIVANPVGSGYWIVRYDGDISTRGSAKKICGKLSDCSGYRYKASGEPIGNVIGFRATVVAAAATPTGKGLWAVDDEGGVWTIGDAKPYGDLKDGNSSSGTPTGMFASPTGQGYTIVLANGQVRTFGDAWWYGQKTANNDGAVVGIAPSMTPAGGVNGYWTVTRYGTVTAFGAAPQLGNLPTDNHADLARGVSGIAALPGGRGYVIVRRNGSTAARTYKPQRWVEIETGGNYLRTTSRQSGAQIHGKPDHGTDSTLWREVKSGDGYQLVNALSGQCLDTGSGPVVQRPCASTATQQFTIGEKTPGRFVLKTVTGGLEYTPETGYMRAMAVTRPALLEWNVAPVVTGPVTLTDEGLALDVEEAATAPGAHVIGWERNGNANQVWLAQIGAPGGYQLKNQRSSLCLEDNDGLVEQQPCDGSPAQSFEGTRRGNRVIPSKPLMATSPLTRADPASREPL